MLPDDVRSEVATLVRTGVHDRESLVEQFTLERYEPGELDADAVAAEVAAQFAAHAEEQKAYPEITDCDRLDAAFAALNGRGLVALQNVGFSQGDGFEEVKAAARARIADGGDVPIGHCFYHVQDLERAAAGGPLYLAFGPRRPSEERTVGVEIGGMIREELERAGLKVEWDGTFDSRLCVHSLKWQKR